MKARSIALKVAVILASILLVAGSFSGSSNVTATGGAGGVGTVGSTGEDISGGAGGDGRIRFAH